MNAELQGQECDSLTDISPIGCILATTTATIVLVQPQLSMGRHSITCKPLKLPQGWLGGISRLIPSIIFGSLQSSHIMETVRKKFIPKKKKIQFLSVRFVISEINKSYCSEKSRV